MSGGEPVGVSADPGANSVRLVLRGRVTVGGAGRLHAAARDLLGRRADVTVDLAGVEHLDVAALQILLCLGRDLRAVGKRYEVVGVAAALAESLRLAGVGA